MGTAGGAREEGEVAAMAGNPGDESGFQPHSAVRSSKYILDYLEFGWAK